MPPQRAPGGCGQPRTPRPRPRPRPRGAPPPPLALKLAASKVAGVTAVEHPLGSHVAAVLIVRPAAAWWAKGSTRPAHLRVAVVPCAVAVVGAALCSINRELRPQAHAGQAQAVDGCGRLVRNVSLPPAYVHVAEQARDVRCIAVALPLHLPLHCRCIAVTLPGAGERSPPELDCPRGRL